jgi:hypothetical protein
MWVRVGEGAGALALDAQRAGPRLVGRLRQGRDTLPFSLARIPDYPTPSNRVEAWAQDLDALATRFLPLDRSFGAAERARFLAHVADTRARLPTLGDDQVVARMASALALAGNAHTRLYLLRNASQLRRLPVRVWWFRDGLRVVRATPAYRHLLGCRVDRVAGVDARRARDVVSAAFAGTPSWGDYMSTYSLTSPEMLHGFGLAPDADSVVLGVSGCAAATAGRAAVTPLPLAKRRGVTEAWWDLSPLHRPADAAAPGDRPAAPAGSAPGGAVAWAHVLDARRDSLPLYLRRPNDYYWFEYLPASGVLYVQYNRAADMPAEDTRAFGERLLAEFDRRPVRAFVLDLRFNTGGNLTLAADLMRALQARTRGLPRWVVTGRATFSAGITQVASWSAAGDVTLVGEPVGDAPDFWAEGGNIRLPNSGFDAHFANGAHSYSPAPCPAGVPCYDLSAPGVNPQLRVAASWDVYVRGRDPAMAAVLASVGAKR